MPLSKETDAARKREARAFSVATVGDALGRRSKRIAEASALALALEENIAQSLAATYSAKLLRATKRIIDFKVNFHDSLRKKSCPI